MENNKLYAIMWLCSTIIIVFLVLSITYYNCYAVTAYTQAGYEETTLIGANEAHWIKSKETK